MTLNKKQPNQALEPTAPSGRGSSLTLGKKIMSLPKEEAWFASKKYGYGWGLPKRWQGWVVMLGYLGLLVIGAFTLARSHPLFYLVLVVVSSVALVGICQWKSQPAKWRWGDDDDEEKKKEA